MDKDYDIISKIAHRRGIYKDVVRSSEPYTEYQLRPNVFIAMMVAPELFEKTQACQAIMTSKRCSSLLWASVPWILQTCNIDLFTKKTEETGDYPTPKDFSYHQGPEWLWPMGYFLHSACYFGALEHEQVVKILDAQRRCLFENDWRGLPELTNGNDEFCGESCPNQMWPLTTLLDFKFLEKESL